MKKNIIYKLLFSLLLYSTLLNADNLNNRQKIIPTPLLVGNSVVPQDEPYYTHKINNGKVELIYTKENIPFAQHTANIETPLHKDYEKFFNWKLDETLYVGLISNSNQIANGFSTQWPNNRQINYIGGSIVVDYFANTSWLDALLYHETTHNYQLNTKGSVVSRTLHSLLGNGSFLFPMPFIVPNVAENSFMLEGNAVLNESWHGSGGRLYSGRFKAMMLLQAQSGNIKPEFMYNQAIKFPYSGDIYYQIGGFYNLYLAKKYGLKKVNTYFKNKSEDWYFPFFTNDSMKMSVGSDFESTLYDYSKYYAHLAKNLVLAQGKHLASTQFYYNLSSDKDEIFFITNETAYRTPELVVFNKSDKSVTKDRASWLPGKVLKVDGAYYTQGSNHISPIKIKQGLFNRNAFIKKGTQGKMIQTYLSDGRNVYFDVASSYDYPQLYVGDEYYGFTNSSVVVDNDDNIYYFKNENKGKKRTLYKNKTPLFTYDGFYGIVSDVDSQGSIYFIANSELGSTLYRYKNGKVTRASKADNILEARLINDKEVLLSAISDKDYYYVKNELTTIDEKPFQTTLFFESKDYYGQYKVNPENNYTAIDDSNSYNSLLNMHYSGTNFTIISQDGGNMSGSLNLNFGDPLGQNSANLFLSKDDTDVTIAGLGYANTRYLLEYTLSAYGVVDNDSRDDTRDYGIIAGTKLPFYQAGYYEGNINLTYFQDYDTNEREPFTGSLNFSRYESYGTSMYANYLNSLSLYGVKERADFIGGGEYQYAHDLAYETYIKFSGKYSITNLNTNAITAQIDTRGVKLSSIFFQSDMDLSTIEMPTITDSLYMKSVGYGDIGLSSVLNFSSYWFTFPLSLQRESIYTKYRYYGIEDFNGIKYNVNEIMAGIRFDTVFFNVLSVPISINYYHNDNKIFTKDEHQVRLTLGTSF